MDMAKIGPSKGTRPEVLVQQWLVDQVGARVVTMNDRRYLGSPDGFIRFGAGIAVFVDGRFWHDPRYAAKRHKPHHLTDWTEKARRNSRRDRRVTAALKRQGISVIRIWDSSLTGKARTERTLGRLMDWIQIIIATGALTRAVRL